MNEDITSERFSKLAKQQKLSILESIINSDLELTFSLYRPGTKIEETFETGYFPGYFGFAYISGGLEDLMKLCDLTQNRPDFMFQTLKEFKGKIDKVFTDFADPSSPHKVGRINFNPHGAIRNTFKVL